MLQQLQLFPDTDVLPEGEHLEDLLAELPEWEPRPNGTLVRRQPQPFTPAWCAAEAARRER